jgi:hypothetical protein
VKVRDGPATVSAESKRELCHWGKNLGRLLELDDASVRKPARRPRIYLIDFEGKIDEHFTVEYYRLTAGKTLALNFPPKPLCPICNSKRDGHPSAAMRHVYLLRHGETAWNREERLQGSLDVPITAAGIQQVNQLAHRLQDLRIGRIFTSPLLRARQTGPSSLRRDLAFRLFRTTSGKSIMASGRESE